MLPDCQPWQGEIRRDGYGRAAGHELAHRAAYERAYGPIPDGLEVDHLCRNRACVNPLHLEAVTHEENIRRAVPFWPSTLATHCHNGHEFTPENTYMIPRRSSGGVRQCRTCNREAARRYKNRKKAATA